MHIVLQAKRADQKAKSKETFKPNLQAHFISELYKTAVILILTYYVAQHQSL